MTVVIVGDANADLSASVARFPFEGDDAAIRRLGWGSGGSAANVATALALLGAPARLVARVGADPAATVALRAARAAGVDLSCVETDPSAATGLCVAIVSPGGERTFLSYRGANVRLAAAGDAMAGARWLHIAGHALLEGPQRVAALRLIDMARRHGLPVSLDLCLPLLRERPAETRGLLPTLDLVFANELELAALFPGLSHDAAFEQLARCVPRAAAKLGARGCLAAEAGARMALAAFTVEAVDTNGCGDAYVAGFIHGALGGLPLRDCAQLGNACGALAATGRGAAEALPRPESLRSFLAAYASQP
jgi:sugar/nucleoside kinase (ribokinase family)